MVTTPTDGVHHSVNQFFLVDGAASFIAYLEDVFEGVEDPAMRTPDRDGTLIHAEVRLGDTTVLIADRKESWAITPAFTQIHVEDMASVISRNETRGGATVTRPSPFYGGYSIARMWDPFDNMWWLYQRVEGAQAEMHSNTDWHDAEPSYVYTSLMTEMESLASRIRAG